MTENITQLINNIYEISKRYEEISKVSGENFNIFKITDLTTDEVKLHSAFIAELLNPNGLHGQGNIFLDLFLEMLKSEFINEKEENSQNDEKLEIKNFDTITAEVYTEKSIGNISKDGTEGGKIDILITNERDEKIIIENKIYAPDQKNQLLRYSKFHNKNLFYLNLYGTEPDKKSYESQKTDENLKIDDDFKIISYNQNIIPWLEKCKKEVVDLPLIREVITHYINILKFLTGQSSNKKMENEISKTITASAKNLKTASLISDNLVKAKIQIQYLFWEHLRKEFENKKLAFCDEKEHKRTVTKNKIKNYYEAKRNRERKFGLWAKIFEKDNIVIQFTIEVDWRVYYGFKIKKNGEVGISDRSEYNELCKFLEHNGFTFDSKWWLGWKYTEPKLDFYNFKDTVFDLADKEKLEQTVAKIVDNSIEDVEIFKKKVGTFFK